MNSSSFVIQNSLVGSHVSLTPSHIVQISIYLNVIRGLGGLVGMLGRPISYCNCDTWVKSTGGGMHGDIFYFDIKTFSHCIFKIRCTFVIIHGIPDSCL